MLNELVLIVSLISLVVLLIILYKVRRMHNMLFFLKQRTNDVADGLTKLSGVNKKEIVNIYNQIQSYQDLINLIAPRKPLPLLRGWAASPDILVELCRHALAQEPKVIMECSSGASTLVLARCCELNGAGHVYSLEHDANYARQTRQRLVEQQLSAWATVIHAPLVEYPQFGQKQWYSLEVLGPEVGECEMLFVDGPPQYINNQARYPALPLLMDRLANNCVVYLDDAERVDEKEIVKRWLAEYQEFKHEYVFLEKGCSILRRGALTH